MNKIFKAYENIPLHQYADKLYCRIPNRFKYGRVYSEYKALLCRSSQWSKEQHETYQFGKLKELLIHAYENTTYYRNVFDRIEFSPYNFSSFSEMQRLPFLDKTIIKTNFDDLIAKNISRKHQQLRSTGGTTGNQLYFLGQDNTKQMELPFVESIWERVGFIPEKKTLAVLRNDLFVDEQLFKFNYRHNKLIINNFHLDDKNIHAILDRLSKDRIEYLHTYPSAALCLAEYIRREGYSNPLYLRAILVTSENIYPGQKEIIEETLGGRVFTFYGHSERACIAGWCEYSDYYHINSEYGYTELIGPDNRVITKSCVTGEIVCTGFGNIVMPFIRYRTGDYSSYAEEQHCKCGRNYTLLNDIQGRWLQEMLVRKDSSKVSITALNMHSDIFRNVRNYQIIQNSPGELVIRVVKGENYSASDEDSIKKEFMLKLGGDFSINFVYDTDIEKTKAGKHKYLIQNINSGVVE